MGTCCDAPVNSDNLTERYQRNKVDLFAQSILNKKWSQSFEGKVF